MAKIAEESRAAGTVVVYPGREDAFSSRHETITRSRIAERLAALKGFDFAGDHDPSRAYRGPVYFVPADTLIGVAAACGLGIRSESDLFGGVVPYSFIATKAITHPLVDPGAAAPAGWCPDFQKLAEGAVLAGFSAFSLPDARRAGRRLLEHGPARIKPVRATGGRGQSVVRGMAELDAVLQSLDASELATHGVVLEEDLNDVTTYSVGQLRVAELTASYYGTQRMTRDNGGAAVYGGSDLVVVRGDFASLLELDLPAATRQAVAQARAYDAAAVECFPGLLASRRNYDVAEGVAADGDRRSGVLEQSWRIGGASSAEVAALEAFRAKPDLRRLRASSVEVYGRSKAPPRRATVYFRGLDESVGLITKYALTESHGDP